MIKHTPGPWTVTRVSKSTILKDLYISASPERIARVVVPNTAQRIHEYEANARLIAAAPELLEALKEANAELEYLNDPKGFVSMRQERIMEKARSAIAKAENKHD